MTDKSREINKPSLWVWKIIYIVIVLAALAGLNYLAFTKGVSAGIDTMSMAVFLLIADIPLIGFLISLFLEINQKVNCDEFPSKAPLVCVFVFAGLFIFVVLVLAPDPPRLFRQRIQPVILVPSMAPSTMPMACLTFIMPELTKPTTMTEVADEDWMTAVTPVPSKMPFTVFPESL